MPTATLTQADLLQFSGSDQFYRHGIVRNIVYTEGAKYLAEHAGAYWLLDEIALAQRGDPKVKAEEFQTWKLTVADQKATLTCGDGNGNTVFTKAIEFTDFPLSEVTLWFENNTIYLPGER